MNKDEVITILDNNGLHAKANFGQNFLCDEEIINRIIEVSEAGSDSRVLEIGPGIGALTKPLIDLGCDLTAVEIDKELFSYLKDEYDGKLNLIQSDYLKLPVSDYADKPFDHVLSNIPYYVMTNIMKKLLVDCGSAKKMTFMVEDDAISRIICEPNTKQYGPLSILIGIYGKANREFTVPSGCFYPMPHTTSAVITVTKDSDSHEITSDLCDFIEAAFSKRRKTLSNSLSSFLSVRELKMSLAEALEKKGIAPTIRAEALRPSDLVELYDLILL
ncbi:MAG: ribosomal RNA small subunit methyltransferase A [Clostridiales bacterium]|nr:ribosomal RNA small subunit methyltransferase A [Clostridiales bacterium]